MLWTSHLPGKKHLKCIEIALTSDWLQQRGTETLEQALQPYHDGVCPVQLHYQQADAEVTLALGAQWYLSPKDELLYDVRNLMGEDNVKMVFH